VVEVGTRRPLRLLCGVLACEECNRYGRSMKVLLVCSYWGGCLPSSHSSNNPGASYGGVTYRDYICKFCLEYTVPSRLD